eukprot:gene1197-570_t
MEVTMTVFRTDKGAPVALNNSVNVTLRIVAVNEYSPVLKHAAQITMLLAADRSVGEQILQINATDDDYDADGRLLFSFTGGNEAGVFNIDNSTGVVTLVSVPTGQFYALDILVSDQAPIAERKSVTVQVVLLNLRSSNGTGSGSVYVGSVRGSVPLTISSSSSMSVPVHINVGTQDLAAFDVNITYDSSIIRYIADITFTGILSIASTAGSKNVLLVDKNAEQIPQQLVKPTSCPQTIIGDANKDCLVDIRDAAFIQTYAREAMNGFTSAVGRRLQSEVNDVQRLSLDTDKNGVVDYEDAKMSRDVVLGYSAFISNVTLANPAAPDCKLAITASLRNMRGDAVSNAQVFVILSYTSNALNAELSNSGLASVTSYSLAGNVHGTVLKLNSLGSGLYKIESMNPKLRKNGVGMTLVFSLTTSASQIKVTDTFKKPSNSMAGSKVTVDFGSGIKTDVYQLYAPQSVVNFTVPNSICQNPTVTKHFKLTFDMSFNTIQGKEAAFISAFKSFFLKKYSKPGREIILSNITATPGSIVVGFNVKTLVIDGKENIPPPQPVSKGDNKTLIIIIVVVVVVLLFFIVVVVVVWLKKRKQRVKTISIDEIGNPRKKSNHSTPLHLKDIELKKRKNSPDSNDIIFTDVAVQSSRMERLDETSFDNAAYQSQDEVKDDTSRKPSPQPEQPLLTELSREENAFSSSVAPVGLPTSPSMTSIATESRLTVDQARLSLSQSTNDGAVYKTMEVKQLREEGIKTLHRVCQVSVNINGKLEDLRVKLAEFPFLARQKFVFLTSKFESINPRKESSIAVNRIYKSIVKIRILHGTDGYELFCPCGKVSVFKCPTCAARGYCSEFCQENDVIEHKKICTQGNKAQKQRDSGKRMSRVSHASPPSALFKAPLKDSVINSYIVFIITKNRILDTRSSKRKSLDPNAEELEEPGTNNSLI